MHFVTSINSRKSRYESIEDLGSSASARTHTRPPLKTGFNNSWQVSTSVKPDWEEGIGYYESLYDPSKLLKLKENGFNPKTDSDRLEEILRGLLQPAYRSDCTTVLEKAFAAFEEIKDPEILKPIAKAVLDLEGDPNRVRTYFAADQHRKTFFKNIADTLGPEKLDVLNILSHNDFSKLLKLQEIGFNPETDSDGVEKIVKSLLEPAWQGNCDTILDRAFATLEEIEDPGILKPIAKAVLGFKDTPHGESFKPQQAQFQARILQLVAKLLEEPSNDLPRMPVPKTAVVVLNH